jgi:hypothetical protein
MKIRFEGNRVKVYDEKGELITEREATLEDILKALVETLTKVSIEGELDLKTGKVKLQLKVGE